MLVLSRKPGEEIRIGDHIKVTVVRIGPNIVRIGIEAPGDIKIIREELFGLEMVDQEGIGAELGMQQPVN